MAIGLAICHGLMMTPIQVLKDKHPTNDKWKGMSLCYLSLLLLSIFIFYAAQYASFCRVIILNSVFDYHFSFYSTVFVFSTIYFLIYCVIRQTRAHVERELVIPAAIYGVLWTIGSFTTFVLIDWVPRQEWHSGSAPPTSCPRSWPIQSPPDCLRSSLPSSMSSSTRLLGYGSNLL